MTSQRLFISHASEDAEVTSRVVSYLEAQGVPCWISSRDIPPRAIYADVIADSMRACSACVVIMSAAANESKAVKRELELASHYDKPFVPIRIDATEPAAGVDYYLRSSQWLDYRRDGAKALDRIAAQLDASAPAPSEPAQNSRRAPVPRLAFVAAFAIILLALVGGWFVSQRFGSPTGTASSELPETIVAALTGSYKWDGIECGAGPSIAYQNDRLVFEMTGTPTYTHAVIGLENRAGDADFVVRTRVEQPADHAGETYALRGRSERLEVVSGTQTDEWQRCVSTR